MNNCKKCGALLSADDQFCKVCGAQVEQLAQQSTVTTQANTQSSNNGFNQGYNPTPNMAGPSFNQPTPPNQPNCQNNFNQQSQYNMPNKSNNAMYIVLGVIAVVAIVAVAFFAKDVLSKDNNSSTDSSDSTTVASSNTSSVNAGGFNFKIPNDLLYDIDSDGVLIIGDSADTWLAYVEIQQASFETLNSRKSQLIPTFTAAGYTASNLQTKTYSNKSFITLELSASGVNCLVALTSANSAYVFALTVYDVSNDYNYDIFSTLAPILSSVTYVGTTNNLEISGNDIDLSSIITSIEAE